MNGIPRLAALKMWDYQNLVDAFRHQFPDRTDEEHAALVAKARLAIVHQERIRARRGRRRLRRMHGRAA